MLHALRLTLTQEIGTQREAMLEWLAATTESLNVKIRMRASARSPARSMNVSTKVFKKTNETFVNVMTRLATIDEAQKKIEKSDRQRR